MGLGGITRALFGGSKSKNESGNKFADQINTSFSPWIEQGGQGFGRMGAILGGGEEGAQALKDWWGSSGGQFQLEQGLGDVNDRFHSLGLGRSGSAMKAMEGYRSDLASTKLGEYLGHLGNMNQQALGAGGLVTGAGQYSKGSGSESTGGLGKAIGGLLGAVFSDRRLKTDISRIGEDPDGLGRYRYRYHWESEPREGVMADEVARLRPWALGPEIGGFQTVRYDLLEA